MKKYLRVIAVVVFMIGLATACEKDQVNEELYEVATDGDEVKRPGGGD